MNAEIIAIGSELTCGSKLDTNSQWLSRELESLGWTVTRHTTLADDMDAIVHEFQAASGRANVVLVTGGLGPTLDDITRDALALAFGQPLVRDAESLRQIEAMFVARGRVMPERNQRQADRPERAEAIPNTCGTAPGIRMTVPGPGSGTCLFAAMPGVPAEMRPMFDLQVRPYLLDSSMVLCRRVIRTFGYGESEAERMLGELTCRGRNPEVGITASEAVISLWVTSRAPSAGIAEQMCEETLGLIRERLGESVYAEGNSELHEVVAEILKSRNQRMALLEGSTTGGLLALWMTENDQLSEVVRHATVMTRGAFPASMKSEQSPGMRNGMDAWADAYRVIAEEWFTSGDPSSAGSDYLLMSSPFEDLIMDSGVAVRRGYVAVAARGFFEAFDASMSGNLAIFRQRAARTALNRLRLLLTKGRIS